MFNQIPSINKDIENSYPKNTQSEGTHLATVHYKEKKEIGHYVNDMKKRSETIIDNIGCDRSQNETHLFGPDNVTIDTLAGFTMWPYFKEYVFTQHCNYQQLLCRDLRFIGYLQLAIGTTKQLFFDMLLKKTI